QNSPARRLRPQAHPPAHPKLQAASPPLGLVPASRPSPRLQSRQAPQRPLTPLPPPPHPHPPCPGPPPPLRSPPPPPPPPSPTSRAPPGRPPLPTPQPLRGPRPP